MSYTKKTWADRISEYPTRRTLTDTSDSSAKTVTVAREEGTISQEGDAFSAANMNDLESRIGDGINDPITVTQFGVAVATWSTATTTIDGTAYYTYVIPLTAVNTDVPDVMIGAADTLPTADEQDAFNCIKYAVVDDVAKTLTLYAESLPTSLFYVKVRGVV